MKYKFYTTSKNAWDVMYDAIAKAKQSIYIEMYIFLDDTEATHDFFAQLKEKAKAGVRVRVIVDAFGSFSLSNRSIELLRAAGVEVFVFSRWIHRIHRKILVVDEKVAFVGGVNIMKRSIRWKDIQIKLKGKVVAQVIKLFARTYQTCGGKDPLVLRHYRRSVFRGAKLWVLEQHPVRRIFSLRDLYKKKLSEAKRSVRIVTPYFIPHRWFMVEIERAIRRGVLVEVVIPEHTDSVVIDRVNYHYVKLLAESGVHFYLMPEMNHAKVMIVDDQEGIIGSQNIDALSFDTNTEAGIFFSQEDMVRDLEGIFKEWKDESAPFDRGVHKTRWYDYLLIPLIHIFHSIL